MVDTPLNITLTGSDEETSVLTFNVTSYPTKGSLSGSPPQVTYTPSSSFTGIDSFTFTVSDGTSTSTSATISIVVGQQTYQLPFIDDFETDKGWTVNPNNTDTSKSGQWERANPQGTGQALLYLTIIIALLIGFVGVQPKPAFAAPGDTAFEVYYVPLPDDWLM